MREKIGIVGGGIAGLTAGYVLAKKGFEVFIFEKEKTLGGLASGFKRKGWIWPLEKTIHHIFSNDREILNFSKEIGFNKFFFKSPLTGSLYFKKTLSLYPLDTPKDFLRFPLLSLKEKIRAGTVLSFLRLSPFVPFYERTTALEFLRKTMGRRASEILWEELFRKKFGKYAGKILLSFFWARIKKRSKKLGYPKEGFQAFIDYLEKKAVLNGVKIFKGCEVRAVERKEEGFRLISSAGSFKFNKIVFSLQLPIVLRLARKILPGDFVQKASKIKYLNAVSLVLETDKPVIDNFYWVNIASRKIPFMGVFQHTNFVEKRYYAGSHICYLGWYCKEDDWIWRAEKEEIVRKIFPYLQEIGFEGEIKSSYLFKAPFAQPIFDRYFVKNKPSFRLPVPGLYFAGFELSYPYDRGTNYAVKVGRRVASTVIIE